MLPSNLKDLYLKWLHELVEGLDAKQEQLTNTYRKAIRNLEEEEGVFYSPKDLRKVKGIGATIVKRLESKLEKHCKEIGVEVPGRTIESDEVKSSPKKRQRTALRIGSSESHNNDTDNNNEQTSKKRKRKYIPKKRSGAYAILLALLELNAVDKGFIKQDVATVAQKYTDHSMTPNFSTKEYYSAWSSIAQLSKHDLVLIEGRPQQHSLTDEGLKLAIHLKLADQIEFETDTPPQSNPCSKSLYSPEHTANFDELVIENNIPTIVTSKSNLDTSINQMLLERTFGSQEILKDATSLQIASRSHTIGTSNPFTDQYIIEPLPRDNSDFPSGNKNVIQRRRFAKISYELWSPNSYEIYPIIDHREVRSHSDREYFANAFKAKNMKSEIRQLSLGDIIWVAKNKVTGTQCILNTIVERKRLDDLAMSIRDNRFMEQKNRLEQSGCKHKYYLIEETIGSSIGNMAEALRTTLWVILVYYRFSMIRTSNAEESVDKLHALHTVITESYKDKCLLVLLPNNLKSQDDYRSTLELFKQEFEKTDMIECCHTFQTFQDIMRKRELKTIKELTIHILMLVKGVSLEKAVSIQKEFPTLNHILTAYQRCPSEQAAKLLMFEKFGNAPGAKKISKQLSEKLADVFAV
ncbi:Mus81p [Nakaseomyces bracarensis]|uniref:Mus81p n=1 Tax=Nakaseomyces bracarensis TaxID=273131 RepID=UPI003871560E